MTPYQSELYHHGIKGQKWGKRNGPPYPLNTGEHSESERKARRKKSLNKVEKSTNKSYNKNIPQNDEKRHLTEKQKRVIKGELNELIEAGKSKVESLLSGDVSEKILPKKLLHSESLDETLEKANPLRGTPEGINNCVPSAMAGCLRQLGYDVSAKGVNGSGKNVTTIGECFKRAKILVGSTDEFARSPTDAAEMIRKCFGDNASGICGIKWLNKNWGHAFNWQVVNGTVSFFDSKVGATGKKVHRYWKAIDPFGTLMLARLDNAKIDWSMVSKYLNI